MWPLTWAADNHMYTSWGDGGGFGGSNFAGRVPLGFARIEGRSENFSPVNVSGGKDHEVPTTFSTGKVSGLLSVGSVLYGWLNTQDNPFPNVSRSLIWSSDGGATWRESSWAFSPGSGNFKPYGFVNFGRGYAGARDGFIYIVGYNQGDNATRYLARVALTDVKNQEAYEYFAGLDDHRSPVWSKRLSARYPFFSGPANWGGGVPTYNAGLARYIMIMSRDANQTAVFDAPELWGPWTAISYSESWGPCTQSDNYLLGFHSAQKWTSNDGLTMWFAFSGGGKGECKEFLDAFHLISMNLKLKPAVFE